MSYRCKKCNAIVPQNAAMLRITKHRTVTIAESERLRREIESETPVCAECFKTHTMQDLAEKFKNG